MANIPVQSQGLINSLQRLEPTDLSLDQATIDPGNLVQTYAQDPRWLGTEWTSLDSSNVSINGSNERIDEFDWDVIFGATPTIGLWRYYPNIIIDAAGGTVNPITVRLVLLIRNLGVRFFGDFDLANPGSGMFGPVLLPPGIELTVYNTTVGGAGDNLRCYAHGMVAPDGVGFPEIPTCSYTAGQ